jgi:hypothetical protein
MMTSTPAKPTAIASQRLASSRSPSHQAESRAIKIGTENCMAPVSASCKYCKAQKFKPVMAASIKPRSSCKRGCRQRSKSPLTEGANTAMENSECVRKRIQTTCITGRLTTRHLADASSVANIKVVTVTSAMPMRRFRALSLNSWLIGLG